MELDYPQIWRQTRGDPLVSDEVMYATGPKSVVYALDTRTGEKRWQWDPGIPDERQGGPSICCGDVNRGVALYGDKVFVGLLETGGWASTARQGWSTGPSRRRRATIGTTPPRSR